jgi:hypothetical protein
LADPDNFGVNKGTIIGKKANKYATFFITGALTCIRKGQVCIVPDIHLWDRSLAVMGKILKKDKLYVPRWENGVSFRTGFSNDKSKCLHMRLYNSNTGKIWESAAGYPIKGPVLRKDASSEYEYVVNL